MGIKLNASTQENSGKALPAQGVPTLECQTAGPPGTRPHLRGQNVKD